MKEDIKHDILSVISDALPALQERDSRKLREISDHTLHTASIYQDKDSITIAVAMYAISKLIERQGLDEAIGRFLSQAGDALRQDDIVLYEQRIRELMDEIGKIDSISMFVQKVVNEAQIKKGSKLYEHGISLAQTAGLLGISQWELMKYLGNTRIADRFDDEIDVMQRLEYARGVFGVK